MALPSSVLLSYQNQICPYPRQQLYQTEGTLHLRSLSVLDGFDLVRPLKTQNPKQTRKQASVKTHSVGAHQIVYFKLTVQDVIFFQSSQQPFGKRILSLKGQVFDTRNHRNT